MKVLALLLGLFSFSSFAGDTYIVCENMYDELVINEYVGDKEEITGSYMLMMDYIFDFKYKADSKEFSAVLYDMHGGGARASINTVLDYYSDTDIFRGITCFLAD